MANLRNIVYLTEAQKVTLFTYGQYPYPSATPTITYSDDDIYIVQQSWYQDGSASDYFYLKDNTDVARLTVSNSGMVTAAGFSGSGALLTNLNGANIATGVIDIARLPTGTGATHVALGNHTHDDRYYIKTEIDTKLNEANMFAIAMAIALG